MDPILLKAVLAVVTVAVGMGGLAALGIWGHRAYKAAATRALSKIYEELQLQEAAESPGPKVDFVYHTYAGVFFWATQTTHSIRAPYEVAERALDRFLGYTMRWGSFAYGALFIPLLAYGNYVAQKRSIRRQRESRAP